MKTIYTIILTLLFTGLFSQNKNEMKIVIEKFKKATSIKEIVTEIPQNYDVLHAQYSFKGTDGKSWEMVAKNNNIPVGINNLIKKGSKIYVDLKLKEKDTITPKIMSWSSNIIID